ncbi:MAG: restriction endonuclease subunit S [Neisseria sp.]|nr:restriction endonuclease subunit S [Neisseria sp.]
MGSVATVEKGRHAGKVDSSRLLEMEQAFLANGGEFKTVKVGELFHIQPTKNYGLTNRDLFTTKGNTPVVVNSSLDNGIGGWVDLKPTENGGIITFSDTTTSDSIFYQPKDFIGYSHVQGMYPFDKECWTEKPLRYFVAVFRSATAGLFNYGNKFNRASAREIEVWLPYQNNQIAFDFMENFVYELQASRLRELQTYLQVTGLSDYVLIDEEKMALAQFDELLSKSGG